MDITLDIAEVVGVAILTPPVAILYLNAIKWIIRQAK